MKSNIQHGFNRKYELFYQVPNLNKKQTLGARFGASYFQSHYIDYQTVNNKQQTLNLENEFPIQSFYARAGLIKRISVENRWYLDAEYHNHKISDSINELNSAFYLGNDKKEFFQLELKKAVNKSNTFSYPLTGWSMEATARSRFFFKNPYQNSFRLRLDIAKYFKINELLYYSVGTNIQYSLVDQIGYSENIGLGYQYFTRGYELYVVNGQNYGLLKQNLNLSLIKDKEIKLSFINAPKFNRIPLSVLLSVFSDLSYVQDKYYEDFNPLVNKAQLSAGVGLHFVTYYDRVLVIEYTFNKLGEHGFFINTSFPI